MGRSAVGIVLERLGELHLTSDHCGTEQCFKNSMSTCLLLLKWKNSFVLAVPLGVRVEPGADRFSCPKQRRFAGKMPHKVPRGSGSLV